MQTQRKPNLLPFSLLTLAAAIAFAGWLVGSSIQTSSSAQVEAQQRQTAAITQASIQASNDAINLQIAANNAAAHQANMAMLTQPQQPSALDQLIATNNAYRTGHPLP